MCRLATAAVAVALLLARPARGAGAHLAGGSSPADRPHAPADTARAADDGVVEDEAVVRDVGALAPEFRARLDRVLARMRAEFDGAVEVVETVRSQSRQETLYAQGRTAPGPVVTWTRSSAHLTGYAADVVVGGSYDNPRAYARLATIAQEEGLRTLRPRDPGHVELAGVAGRAVYAAGARGWDAGEVPPRGSARALSRIVPSRGLPPTEPTVFASSPYAAVRQLPATFLAPEPPAGDEPDPE